MSPKHTSLRRQVLALESRTRILESLLADKAGKPALAHRMKAPAVSAVTERLALIEQALGLSQEPIKTIRLEDR